MNTPVFLLSECFLYPGVVKATITWCDLLSRFFVWRYDRTASSSFRETKFGAKHLKTCATKMLVASTMHYISVEFRNLVGDLFHVGSALVKANLSRGNEAIRIGDRTKIPGHKPPTKTPDKTLQTKKTRTKTPQNKFCK